MLAAPATASSHMKTTSPRTSPKGWSSKLGAAGGGTLSVEPLDEALMDDGRTAIQRESTATVGSAGRYPAHARRQVVLSGGGGGARIEVDEADSDLLHPYEHNGRHREYLGNWLSDWDDK